MLDAPTSYYGFYIEIAQSRWYHAVLYIPSSRPLFQIEAFTSITQAQAIDALCQAGGDKIKMRPFWTLVEDVESLVVCDVLNGLLEKETVSAGKTLLEILMIENGQS